MSGYHLYKMIDTMTLVN
jgi:hypothetical protein